MSEKILIYHFTKKENLDTIFAQGLTPGTKYHTLGSRLRNGANYFWNSPKNDLMGYMDNPTYVCLEISIDPHLCSIANMDIASAAFVNFMMAKNGEALHDYTKLINLYDSTAIPYHSYENGSFRVPEIIVPGVISHQNICIADISTCLGRYTDNRNLYNDNLRKSINIAIETAGEIFSNMQAAIDYLEKLGKIKKVAQHDDSTGLLLSYLIGDRFITIELGKQYLK